MRRIGIWLLGAAVVGPAVSGGEAPEASEQIALAVLAAPEGLRAEAGVLGYGPTGAFEWLRPAGNEMHCLADDPAREGLHVACYHRDLEPFMARGRALKAEGVESGRERNEIRQREIGTGELSFPQIPTSLHILEGSSFDPDGGQVEGEYRRWVLYLPWATADSTGLSTEASESAPWLMATGTATAHVMVTPPRPEKPE